MTQARPSHRPATPPQPARERGVVLIVALVFLAVLTILGISAITSTSQEEKMARYTRDYNVALQAAEAALREARYDLGAGAFATRSPPIIGNTGFDANCTNGLCQLAPPGSTPAFADETRWSNTNNLGSVAYGTFTPFQQLPLTPTPGGVAQQPRYLIEYLAPTGSQHVYRITARGWGADPNTMVVLQEEVVR
jgi:type IV pilus assembly protein PilX